MRWLFTLMFGLFAGLFLIFALMELVAGRWKTGLGGLVIAAPIVYALLERWPRKPAPPEAPRERAPHRERRDPPP